MPKYVIGIDLGGTKVEACLLDADRKVYKRYRTFSQPEKGLECVIRNILETVRQVSDGNTIHAVGIGTPGTYLLTEDQLFGSPHTPVYETIGFISSLQSKLNVPLIVENDANCLALAEYFALPKEQYKFVLAVILGTGMGFGIIQNGSLYRGAKGGAGEFGHTTIDYNGRLCECGRRGCAEAYLSGSSLQRRYTEATGEDCDVVEIYRRFDQNDPAAVKLFDESCQIMAEVFANVINSFDLEAIVLGGGVSNLPIWYERVPDLLKKSLFGVPRGSIPILKAQMGDSAGVVGAGYLALRHLGYMDF